MKTGVREKFSLTHGVGWLLDIDMQAGEEIEIMVEFNWIISGITKDWALTAWGEEGEVSVRHSLGIPSQHFANNDKENQKISTETEGLTVSVMEDAPLQVLDSAR